MPCKSEALEALAIRRAALAQRLADEAPFAAIEQKHVKANTPEWAYWHHGYCAALDDAIRLLASYVSQIDSTEGKATSSRLADPDE